jgi:glycosyltransferase involved in cell wall biosynthesis
VHLALSLLTLAPGQVGGSENLLAGLLNEYRARHGPERVTALANRRVAEAYAGRVDLRTIRWYPSARGGTGRAAAIALGLIAPPLPLPLDFDVIHYPFNVPIPRTRLPSVVTVHDLQHHDLPGFFSRAERTYRRLAYDRAARRASLVVTISEFSRERIVAILGVAQEKVVAIPLGIDHERFRPAPVESDAAALDGLDLPERFLYYPANPWPHKNHERLLAAFERAAPNAELVLSGAPNAWLLSLVRRASRVRHLGYVPADALPAIYRRASGLVYPSLYEGAGIPPLEAMACGCPVAASHIPPVEEYCGPGVLYLDPHDNDSIAAAITALLEGQAPDGRERAARYTWRASAERHAEAYQLAIERG